MIDVVHAVQLQTRLMRQPVLPGKFISLSQATLTDHANKAAVVAQLRELDVVKRRMEAACSTLKARA